MDRCVHRPGCWPAVSVRWPLSVSLHLRTEFAIRSSVPSLDALSAQIELLVATPAPDAVKAAQLEGGMRAVIVPKMV